MKIEITTDKIEEQLDAMLGSSLSRNLGIPIHSVKKVYIHHIQESEVPKILLEIITSDNAYYVPGIISNSSDIIANLHDTRYLSAMWDELGTGYTVSRIEMLSIDATNIHSNLFLRKQNEKELCTHMKVYLRTENSQKEAIIAERLAEVDYFPKILGKIYFKDIMGIMVTEKLEHAINLDDYLGKLYGEILDKQEEISSMEKRQFTLNLHTNYRLIAGTMRSFWQIIRKIDNLDQMLIYNPNYWQNKVREAINSIGKNMISVFTSNYEEIFSRIESRLLDWLDETDYYAIHGDCWLRQFILNKQKVFLVDFEDVLYGPLGYDVGGLINSIEQQGVYFTSEYPSKNFENLEKKPIELSAEIIPSLCSQLKPDFWNNHKISWGHECQMGRLLRAVHEVEYLLRHQPELEWLISHLLGFIESLAK